MDAVTDIPPIENEPTRLYEPGSPHRASLQARLAQMQNQGSIDLPMNIGGAWVMGGGSRTKVVQPHAHKQVLGTLKNATRKDAAAAVEAAKKAAPAWRAMSWDDRAAIFLKAADLLAGPWRDTLNAATMLGQSKTAFQAEIDSACELIDFLRFNVKFADDILREQPRSSAGIWNQTDHRPLEGFVYAVTPFNFTAIAGNLPTAPAMMGNVVVWKPAPTQQFAANYIMELLLEAGLPPGVINMVTGDGIAVSDVALYDPDLAGIHFTGSTPVFHLLWRTVGENIDKYRTYPRLVGETGGKDFVFAHPSADPDVLTTAMIRGAYEFQGQKCSAASRAYIPRSVWKVMKDDFLDKVENLSMGPTTDFSNFMAAVIDAKAFAKVSSAIDRAHKNPDVTVAAGGTYDDSEGYFIRPTVALSKDPTNEFFTDEYFGPLLGVHVYDDRRYSAVMDQMEGIAKYALTGAFISQDRSAIAQARETLRYAAGNFYINDKPTGAVVGQQPFGGARASGTNDKAGAAQNLMRWTSARSIKETFVPPTDHTHPHMK
ncbi:MAG: L-glutamate gamma-semialdehyde dehydrogenase [Candidatus Nanopelagicales bacterium]|jgi:1-pyrroline-5-carboxylate dehydrogenase|nr:L-glutamate gamma-semialdehyde dehydrogenase [Candidatus Nanopelagicales bacterium]MCU0298363.1 L-glutamate gamma-semialdehyde dehydrogenase [Candidatus Nanopelagicales bacterium]